MQEVVTNWKQVIAGFAQASEEIGSLHPEILEQAYQEQWFKLFVPEVYGGPGKKLPEILRLEEELSEADGSLGWTVTLCAGAGWFAGFLNPDLAAEIFADRKVCFAGSGAIGGTAKKTPEGYLVNGHWKYASGALHATIFTANCVVLDVYGAEISDEEGKPVIKSFILKKQEVTVLPGWSYFGLVATGSHAFEVNNLLVPLNRTFEINNDITVADFGFDYPFLQLAETTLAVNSLGMVNHFLRLVKSCFYSRSGLKRYSENQIAVFESEFEFSKNTIQTLRNQFYKAFDDSWDELILNKQIAEEQLKKVSTISRTLAHACRQTADKFFPYCGLEAARKETEINRVWRDMHTASQHALFTFEKVV